MKIVTQRKIELRTMSFPIQSINVYYYLTCFADVDLTLLELEMFYNFKCSRNTIVPHH